jgi:hypothetical protein
LVTPIPLSPLLLLCCAPGGGSIKNFTLGNAIQALLEKRRYLNNRSGDFPQVILIVPSHVPNTFNQPFSSFLPVPEEKFATFRA